MLNQPTYYHGIIRKAIAAFGTLFSNIQIQRMNTDGTIGQIVNVPIAYAAKEKWLTRIESDPNLTNNTLITLPRMSFEINGYGYDASRKVNKMNKIAYADTATSVAKSQFSPVPYNVDLSLYLLTKTTEDALSVVEQILPIFTPDYTLSINVIPELSIINDIPVILNNLQVQDDYEGSFNERRSIIHTFNFTMKLNIFGAISTNKITNKIDTLPQIMPQNFPLNNRFY